MRTSERHHLKDNELALAMGRANMWATRNRRTLMMTVVAMGLLVAAAVGVAAWRNSVDAKARALLAEAMVIDEARVVPPAPPPDPATPANATPPTPLPNTYPTE